MIYRKEHIDDMISCDKWVLKNHVREIKMFIQQKFPMELHINLASVDYKFILHVKQSLKNELRISLHLLDDEDKIGITRLCYNNRHKNPPEILTNDFPDMLVPFVGCDFFESHQHIFVNDKYPPLSWAIPLSVTNFDVKEVKAQSDIIEIIRNFCIFINIKTEIEFQARIL